MKIAAIDLGTNSFLCLIAEVSGRYPSASVKTLEDVSRVVRLGENHRIIDFEEKPAVPKSSLITMCLYYFPKSTLGYLPEYLSQSKALDAAGSYIQWLSVKKNVYGFQFNGKWYDIGSIESLNEAQEHFK